MKRTRALSFVLASLLALAANAQQRREPHVVRVVAKDGSPVEHAQVTLFCSDALGDPEREDVVRGATNASGRVTLQVLPGRFYLAFAAREHGDERYVTELAARRPDTTELQFDHTTTPEDPFARIDARELAARGLAPRQLRIEGLAPWRPLGPLRLEVLVAGCSRVLPPIELGERDAVDVPALPWNECIASLFVGDVFVHGSTLWQASFDVPPPQRVSARVVDTKGQPIAGAAIARLVQPTWSKRWFWPQVLPATRQPVATSAADGTATLLIAGHGDPFAAMHHEFPGIAFVASKAGHRETWSGFNKVVFCDHQVRKEKEPRELTFTLHTRDAHDVRFANGTATPPHGVVSAEFSVPAKGTNYGMRDAIRLPRTADGTLRASAVADEHRLLAVALPGLRPPLADDDPFRRAAIVDTLVLTPTNALSRAPDLRELQALKLQILDVTHGPALGAHVVVCACDGDQVVPIAQGMHAIADGSGRVVLPVLPGRWCVLVALGTSWQTLDLEIDEATPVQTVQLEPLPSMTVQLLDGSGAAVANAAFGSAGGTCSRSSADPPLRKLLSEVAFDCSDRLRASVRTDATGTARLPFLSAQGVRSSLRALDGAGQSAEFVLQASDTPVVLTLK